jgi:hypothetical protein
MLEKATREGQLAPFADKGLRQHMSIYADDVVTFLRPRVDSSGPSLLLLMTLGWLLGCAPTSASVMCT